LKKIKLKERPRLNKINWMLKNLKRSPIPSINLIFLLLPMPRSRGWRRPRNRQRKLRDYTNSKMKHIKKKKRQEKKLKLRKIMMQRWLS